MGVPEPVGARHVAGARSSGVSRGLRETEAGEVEGGEAANARGGGDLLGCPSGETLAGLSSLRGTAVHTDLV